MKITKHSAQMGLPNDGQQPSDDRVLQIKLTRAARDQDNDATALPNAASCNCQSMNAEPPWRTELVAHAAHSAVIPRMLDCENTPNNECGWDFGLYCRRARLAARL